MSADNEASSSLPVHVEVYLGREDSIGTSLRSQGQDTTLARLDAWQMKSVWN